MTKGTTRKRLVGSPLELKRKSAEPDGGPVAAALWAAMSCDSTPISALRTAKRLQVGYLLSFIPSGISGGGMLRRLRLFP